MKFKVAFEDDVFESTFVKSATVVEAQGEMDAATKFVAEADNGMKGGDTVMVLVGTEQNVVTRHKIACCVRVSYEQQGFAPVISAQTEKTEPEQAGDALLTEEQLDEKYNPDGDGEHPTHTRDCWQRAVLNDETSQGYWQWVRWSLSA